MKAEKTTRKDYDFAGLPTARVVANFLRWKVLPFGYLERGPGVIWLLSIWFRHRFGRVIARLKIKHRRSFDRFAHLIARLRRLLRRG